ncbi:MAG: hypothetical protein K8L99_29905 [Anaerolineae bacterium]|nr:hypothetical protein [Anaerolineae bacterium]
MDRNIPIRLLVIGAAVLLVTPCALVTLAGLLLPEDASGEQLALSLLPLLVVAQVIFLYWYYRHTTRR